MEKQQVELYLAANADKFPADQIANIKVALENADESKTAAIQALELKNPTTMLIIAWFLGCYGVDRFMLGDTTMGIIKLLTCGGAYIWWLIDLFKIKEKTYEYNFKKFNEKIRQSKHCRKIFYFL